MGDFRFAVRAFRRNPAYAAVAILTLAIAVGGATAIFSVLNAVVLRPLPYRDSGRLVLIRDSNMPRLPEFSVSPGRFVEWQARTRVFEGLAAATSAAPNLTGAGEPRRLVAARVSANAFDVLGTPPLLGRGFTSDEDEPGAGGTIILSEGLWRAQFGGDPSVVGRTVSLDDKPATIVGVMPASFAFPNVTMQAWLPLGLTEQDRHRYGSHYLFVVGRLKAGVSTQAARDDLARAAREIDDIDGNKGWTTLLFPYLDYSVRNVRSGLWVLAGAVTVVLLIACANIANLLLARGVGRQRELGVRTALGATRGRLVRQMLVENLVIGTLGSGLGVLFAWVILRAIVASPSTSLPRAQTIALDGPTVIFAAALAALTPLVFGLIPSLQMARPDLREVLAQGGRTGASSLRARTRGVLIVAEVALAVMLVMGSTLLIRSFARLTDVSPGFETDRQLVVGVSLPETRYGTDDLREQFFTMLVDRVSHLPGVDAAGLTQSVPFFGDYVSVFEIPGRTPSDPTQRPDTNFYAVTPGYLKAMGIPLLRGRGIEATDGPATPRVVVISQTLAEKYFGQDNPVGQKLRVSQGPGMEFSEIIGVAGNVKQYGLDSPTTMQVYEPERQHRYFSSLSLIVRSSGAPENVTAAVRGLVTQMDANLPIATARTLESAVASSTGPRRFTTTVLASFAGVALLLAAIGVYGLVSFTVGQRTQEIGIRVALGAQASSVLKLVFRQGLGLTLAGVALGLGGGFWATRLLDSLLFELPARDPLAFGLAPGVLILAAVAACYWPARRTLKVDPVTALRQS